jgi:ribosomal-protein-alanine N-acetyltransferase
MSAVIDHSRARLRPMREEDIAGVMAIESVVYTHGWTEGIFLDCLRVGYSCWIHEDDGEVVSYGILSLAAGEAHILNVSVKPERQGEGLGRRMIEHLLTLARERGADTAFLEVRPSNAVAIGLYESLGFIQAGIRPDYYPAEKGREDAVIMAKALLDGER